MGKGFSNTLYLEHKLKWNGLLVEANPDFLTKLLKKNRRAWILSHCLSIKNISSIEEFDNVSFWGGIVNQSPDGSTVMPGDIDRDSPYHESRNRRTIKVNSFLFLVTTKLHFTNLANTHLSYYCFRFSAFPSTLFWLLWVTPRLTTSAWT